MNDWRGHREAEAQIEQLRADVERRRLRARDAVERLRATFTLRPGCDMVNHAAEDACDQFLREKEVLQLEVEKLTAQRDRLAEEARSFGLLVNQAQQLGLELRRIDDRMQFVATKPQPHVHPDTGCYACVHSGCEEEPVFCTEHAGVAVTIAQHGITVE